MRVSQQPVKRCFAVLLFAVTAAAVQTAAPCQVEWSGKPFDGALAQAAAEKGFVMVDFFTTWCVPCKMLDATAWKDPSITGLLKEHHVVALKLDAEKEGKDLAARYKVRGYPTVVLLNATGGEVSRFMGVRPVEAIRAQFGQALKDPRTLDDLRKAAQDDPANLQASYDLAQRLEQSGSPVEKTEALGLLATIIQKDRDNARGLGAKALMSRTSRVLATTLRPDLMMDRMYFAAAAKTKGPYPDIFQGAEDPELMQLREKTGQAFNAYLKRLEDDCAVQLLAAADLLGTMKDVQPALTWQDLSSVQSVMSEGQTYPNRRLAEAFHLFAARACSDATALNECAWYFYLSQTHLDLAESLIRRCLAMGPNPNAEDTLAHVLFTTGRGEEAFKIERKLIANAKAAGDEASAKIFQDALASWEKGVADQTLPSGA